jgi:hypothetical protein
MKIEDNPAFSNSNEALPRMCSVIGGEKTPLKIGERFEFRGGKYFVGRDGEIECANSIFSISITVAFEIINHPEEIIRPQFSDDEKALFRLCVAVGRPIFAPSLREKNRIVVWDKEEINGTNLIPGILTQIKEKFDAAAYLESEESHD